MTESAGGKPEKVINSPGAEGRKMSRPRKALGGLAIALLFFVLLEVILALAAPDLGWEVEAPMVYEQIRAYLGEGGLWSDEKGISLNFSIYRDDFGLLWAMKPGLDETVSDFLTPSHCREKTRFRITTDARGFRSNPDSASRNPGGIRVACFGDSHCFGWGLDPASAWPSVMQRSLAGYPGGAEVLNFGVPGYSSAQGLLLVREELEDLEADVVVISYGFNDNLRASCPDSGLLRKRRSPIGSAAWAAGRLRTAKLIALIAGESPTSRHAGDFRARRVPPEEYESNLMLMADECRKRGAGVVFLSVYNGYRSGMKKVAQSLGAEVVDVDGIAGALDDDAGVRPDPEDSAGKDKAISTFGAGFLEANPKYLTHIDAAHYNGRVHLHAGRAAAKAALAAARRRAR